MEQDEINQDNVEGGVDVVEDTTTAAATATETTSAESATNCEPAVKWYDSLDDELKTNPNITKHKDVGGLAKAYVESVKKLGQKGFTPLPDNATPEQRAAYNAIRRGEAIKAPEDYSWGKGTSDEGRDIVGSFKQALFNAGADNYTANEVLSALKNYETQESLRQEAHAEKVYAAEAEKLRSEWGENYVVNLKANDILLGKYPEAARVLKTLGVDKIAGVQLMLHHLNTLASDGQIKISEARTKSIDERIDAITNSDAYKYEWHPDHKSARAHRAQLIMELTKR